MATEQNLHEQNKLQSMQEDQSSSTSENQSEASAIEDNYKSWKTRDALDEVNLTKITQTTNDVATNDGSTLETLDTAFHDKPGYAEGETVSGSNRADYYEARSDGKSDVEEELEVLKKKQQE